MQTSSPDYKRFAKVFNDLKTFPSIKDVAAELGLAPKTVRNKAAILRARRENGENVPEILLRETGRRRQESDLSPEQHANIRARTLQEEVRNLLRTSRYPVINAEALIVNSHMTRRYSRDRRGFESVESTPRTWLKDTLRVRPVKSARNRVYLFTGAQNDAEVHEPFWANLHAYARFLGAEVVVGPWTYETQWWSENNPIARSYDPSIRNYLCFGQMAIGDNFIFAGEMNTLPTANRPISDLVTYSRGRWAVFPHAKLQLKSVPSTDPAQQAHQVMTTGACTHPQVIPRKAGVKSIFHHVIGATLVEFDEVGDIFCRQINAADDGSFYDLDVHVTKGRVTTGHRIKALTPGDIHVSKIDAANKEAVFGAEGSMLATLRPQHLFLHDIHDHEARNHHNAGDNALSYELAVRKRESVLEEIEEAADFLVEAQRPGTTIHVVDSNHDLALDRYINEGRYRNDGGNIKIGLQLDLALIEQRERRAKGDVKPFSLLEHAIRMTRGDAVKKVDWIYDGSSFVLDGVELGHHGFRGPDGSRGNVAAFARIGRKMSIGHRHSPEIMDGVYVSGAMQLQMGYNKGPSSWAVSHIVHYPNGKRALVTMQNGKWRASPCCSTKRSNVNQSILRRGIAQR